MAYIVMAYTVMAYIVMAYIVMAYTVMAYAVMAYTVMAGVEPFGSIVVSMSGTSQATGDSGEILNPQVVRARAHGRSSITGITFFSLHQKKTGTFSPR